MLEVNCFSLNERCWSVWRNVPYLILLKNAAPLVVKNEFNRDIIDLWQLS